MFHSVFMKMSHHVLSVSKNSSVEATWDDSAFQLRLDAHGNKIGDKLDIETVDIFGFPCVPNVGAISASVSRMNTAKPRYKCFAIRADMLLMPLKEFTATIILPASQQF